MSNEVNIFERASRLNLMFPSPLGVMSVADLWNISLSSARSRANLNDIAKGINRLLKDSAEEEFVSRPAAARAKDEVPRLQLEIVKHIIAVREAEEEVERGKSAKKAQREKLLGVLAQKQEEELKGLSKEEVEALIAAL